MLTHCYLSLKIKGYISLLVLFYFIFKKAKGTEVYNGSKFYLIKPRNIPPLHLILCMNPRSFLRNFSNGYRL